VRASYDAKATVKIGPFARGGYSRTGTQAADHDFKATGNLTPAGIFVPGAGELDLYFSGSKVTSDFIADVIEDWWGRNRGRFGGKKKLVLNLDNGPENQSRRSQFLLRMILLAQKEQITVHLAYYPPYHSKYNPIERCWGILENYWRVERTTKHYPTGVRLSRKGLARLESFVQRQQGLEKWFVVIPPPGPDRPILPDQVIP
jgi:transposase